MSSQDLSTQPSWWKLVLTGFLAFVFGAVVFFFPANMMFPRLVDVAFGKAKPFSGGITAVAAMVALLALVAIDGLLSLFGSAVIDKHITKLRGILGVAVAIIGVFWPGMTMFVAVELIGLWAALGALELIFARGSGKNGKEFERC